MEWRAQTQSPLQISSPVYTVRDITDRCSGNYHKNTQCKPSNWENNKRNLCILSGILLSFMSHPFVFILILFVFSFNIISKVNRKRTSPMQIAYPPDRSIQSSRFQNYTPKIAEFSINFTKIKNNPSGAKICCYQKLEAMHFQS